MPGVFFDQDKEIEMVVHVDDLLIIGHRKSIVNFRKQLEKLFEMESQILGPLEGDESEVSFFGRTIAWTDEGLIVEGDRSTWTP